MCWSHGHGTSDSGLCTLWRAGKVQGFSAAREVKEVEQGTEKLGCSSCSMEISTGHPAKVVM